VVILPCKKVGNKWQLGSKGGKYKSKKDCEKAYAAYLAKKSSKRGYR